MPLQQQKTGSTAQLFDLGLLDQIKIVEVVFEDVIHLGVVHLPVELFPSEYLKQYRLFLLPHLLVYLRKVPDVLLEFHKVFFVPCACKMVEVMVHSGMPFFLKAQFFPHNFQQGRVDT